MPITLDATCSSPGNTAQAIGFYQEVFGGQTTITRRGDVDPAASETERNQVVNALLTGGDVTLRGQRSRRFRPPASKTDAVVSGPPGERTWRARMRTLVFRCPCGARC